MPDERPNILQVILHDLGTHLGCYGADVHSPAVDTLAADGVRFTNHFCTAPQCSPSRGSIITGRYPHTNGLMGLVNRGWSLPDREVTLPQLFSAAGYETRLFGIQHEHRESSRLGYEFVDDLRGGWHGRQVADRLCRWLGDGVHEPFYVSAGFMEVHIDFAKGPTSAERLERIRPLPWLPDHPALRQDLAELAHSVSDADLAVARILDALDCAGLAERTIVVFTTDHGLPLARAKATLYDPGLRTALIMRWPGRLQANRVVSELASNVDYAPTILELAGVPVPPAIQGRSLAGLLLGGAYEPRAEVFAELTYHDSYNPMRAIRTHRHKLIWNLEPRPRSMMPIDYWNECASARVMLPWLSELPPPYELYDLAVDPWEQHNLADRGAYSSIAEDLRHRLERWMAETGDPILAGPVPAPHGWLG